MLFWQWWTTQSSVRDSIINLATEGPEGRRKSRGQRVLSPTHLGREAPTWQLPWVAKDGDCDEEGSSPSAQEADPPGAHPQWALGGQLRPAARDTWGQCCAHSTQSTHTRHPSACWSVRGRDQGSALMPPHTRSGTSSGQGHQERCGVGMHHGNWLADAVRPAQVPSSGACQAASQQGREDRRLAGGQVLPARAGQGTPHTPKQCRGGTAGALASAKSMGAVAAGLSRLWEAVHLHCPLPQATLSKWPPDSQVHQSRASLDPCPRPPSPCTNSSAFPVV